MVTAGRKSIEIVKALIKAGADIETKDKDGKTALMLNCCYKNIIEKKQEL